MNQLTPSAPGRRSDEDVAEALLCGAARSARWPDGSLLVGLDGIVIRTRLVSKAILRDLWIQSHNLHEETQL